MRYQLCFEGIVINMTYSDDLPPNKIYEILKVSDGKIGNYYIPDINKMVAVIRLPEEQVAAVPAAELEKEIQRVVNAIK